MVYVRYYVKVKAEKFEGYQCDGVWVCSGATGRNINTYEEAEKLSNEYIDELIKKYDVDEVIERHSHCELKVTDWNNSYNESNSLNKYIVDIIYPDINDGLKVRNSFDKFRRCAMNKLKEKGLLVTCSRCEGSGNYSRNCKGETYCYKCEGFKYQLPRDSKKFRISIKEIFSEV